MRRGVLSQVRRRLGAWFGFWILLLLAALLGGASLAAVLLDAMLDLPAVARVLAPWLAVVCGLVLLAFGAFGWRRLQEYRLARLLERNEASLGNRLTNAVQFATEPRATPVTELLRLEAVALGRKAADTVQVWPVIRQRVKTAGVLAGAAAAAWLLLTLVSGDVLQAVLPRFLDPFGDHPPYSKLRFEVSPGKAEVLYGGQLEIRAKIGPDPLAAEKLWLVAESGTNVFRSIMFLAPDKSFFQSLVNLREPAEYYVTDGRARSHRFPVSIRYTPRINLVEVTTAFPAYTGKAERTSRLSEEPQALPEETKVSFRVVSNRPLQSGELVLTPVLGGEVKRVPLQTESEADSMVTGGFTLTEPVVFSISVRDVTGLQSADPRQGRFNISPDERPRLFVLEPGRDAVATPSIRVPVRVEASDDYGVTRMVWLRGFNRSIERPFQMNFALKAGPQSVEAASALEFDKLGVRPGDVIEYYFEAADNYPKGPNLALSKLYRIQIISNEQYEMILRQAAARKALFEPYFALNAWLRRMAERARNLEQKSQTEDPTGRKEAAALAEDLAKYERELAKLLEQAVLFDVEQAFRNTLVAQHSAIAQLSKKLGKSLGSGEATPGDLSQLREALEELAATADQEIERPARQIAAVAQLLARANTFVKLASRQAVLAQMARRFSDRADSLSRMEQVELQELAHQQRRIEEALRALLTSLPDLLAQVPDEPEYATLRGDVQAFLQAVADAQIESDLSESGKSLGALDGKLGYMLAQRAAEKMDRLIAKCEGLPGKGEQCLRFQPSMPRGLGNTLGQILAAMGANAGQGGEDGYGLFNDDVSLYGPNVQLSGEQAGGRRDGMSAGLTGAERVRGGGRDPALPEPGEPGRVRLQPDAKFPLRYRDLVGEYFRVIGESEMENGGFK